MNRRSIAIHVVLLLLAGAGAWITFRGGLGSEAVDDEEGVILVQAGEGDVERLVYQHDGRTLRLEAHRDAKGRWFEGNDVRAADSGETTVESEPGAEAATRTDTAADEATPPATEATTAVPSPATTVVFLGGAAVESLWHALEPLRARRVLGTITGEKLKELGLVEPTASLTVTVRGRNERFALGNEVYGGSDRYARESDGRVVVLPQELVQDLEASTARLMERRLLHTTRPEVEAIQVGREGRTMKIVQHDSSQPGAAYWTREGEAEPSGELQAWTDKFFRLEAWGYRSGEPKASWRSEASIAVTSGEAGREDLEIWSSEEEGKRIWLARSEHTRLVAELGAAAEEVCKDLDGLLP